MTSFFVDADIRKASTIHSDFYTSDEVFEISKEKIFQSSWQFMLDKDALLHAQKILPKTILPDFLNESVVFVRANDNSIRCLSNVCTHRGNILIEHACDEQHIRCRYHGRIFNLDGTFKQMPEFKEADNFPSEKDNLPNLALGELGKFIFTSIRPTYNFDLVIMEMKSRIGFLPLHDFKFAPALTRDYMVNAHWALYCENYLEGFHIPFVHPDLNQALNYGEYTTELFDYASLQIGIAKDKEHIFDLPTTSPDFGKRVAAYYFWLFPNTMFNFYPWGLSINVVQPITKALTKVSYITYIYDESKIEGGAGAALDKVEQEDEAIVENVQKGIRSHFYTQGRYSPTRETGTHHFHRLLCKQLKNNN